MFTSVLENLPRACGVGVARVPYEEASIDTLDMQDVERRRANDGVRALVVGGSMLFWLLMLGGMGQTYEVLKDGPQEWAYSHCDEDEIDRCLRRLEGGRMAVAVGTFMVAFGVGVITLGAMWVGVPHRRLAVVSLTALFVFLWWFALLWNDREVAAFAAIPP